MSIFLQILREILKRGQVITRSELWPILSATAVLVVVGALGSASFEKWSLLEGLYFAVITMTTIGYGDYSPATVGGRIFTMVFALFAIGIAGYAISTLAAYTIQRRQRKLTNRLRKRRMQRIESLQQHYILCGAEMLGIRIAEEFYLAKVPYLIIDNDEHRLKYAMLFSHPDYFMQKLKNIFDFNDVDLSEYEALSLAELSDMLNTPYILDDPTDDAVLWRAGIERAQGLIAALPDDRDNLSVVIGARGLAKRAENTSLRIMSSVTDSGYVRKMLLAGADQVRIPAVMGGLEMASHMINPEMGRWWYKNKHNGELSTPLFNQLTVSDQPDWVGATVTQVHANSGVMILAVKRDEELLSPPPHDFQLVADDVVIVLK